MKALYIPVAREEVSWRNEDWTISYRIINTDTSSEYRRIPLFRGLGINSMGNTSPHQYKERIDRVVKKNVLL